MIRTSRWGLERYQHAVDKIPATYIRKKRETSLNVRNCENTPQVARESGHNSRKTEYKGEKTQILAGRVVSDVGLMLNQSQAPKSVRRSSVMPRHVVTRQLHLLHRSTARGEHVIRGISTHMISILLTDIK